MKRKKIIQKYAIHQQRPEINIASYWAVCVCNFFFQRKLLKCQYVSECSRKKKLQTIDALNIYWHIGWCLLWTHLYFVIIILYFDVRFGFVCVSREYRLVFLRVQHKHSRALNICKKFVFIDGTQLVISSEICFVFIFIFCIGTTTSLRSSISVCFFTGTFS